MARLGIPAVLIGLFTWLLWEDRFGAASFTTLTGGALVVGLALQFGGRLREIDIKGKLILDKMETVKKDVYAKAESVARLAEDVVEAAVFSATKMNRLLDGKHLHQEMLKVRDRMSALLQDSGAGPEKVEAVVKTPINQTIIHDLKSEVRRAVGPAAKGCGEADTVQKFRDCRWTLKDPFTVPILAVLILRKPDEARLTAQLSPADQPAVLVSLGAMRHLLHVWRRMPSASNERHSPTSVIATCTPL